MSQIWWELCFSNTLITQVPSGLQWQFCVPQNLQAGREQSLPIPHVRLKQSWTWTLFPGVWIQDCLCQPSSCKRYLIKLDFVQENVFISIFFSAAPKVSNINEDGCLVEWSPLKQFQGHGELQYRVSLTKVKDNESKTVSTIIIKVIWKRASESTTLNFHRIEYLSEINFYVLFFLFESVPPQRLFPIVRYLGLGNVLKITKTSRKFKIIDSLRKCDLIKEKLISNMHDFLFA